MPDVTTLKDFDVHKSFDPRNLATMDEMRQSLQWMLQHFHFMLPPYRLSTTDKNSPTELEVYYGKPGSLRVFHGQHYDDLSSSYVWHHPLSWEMATAKSFAPDTIVAGGELPEGFIEISGSLVLDVFGTTYTPKAKAAWVRAHVKTFTTNTVRITATQDANWCDAGGHPLPM